MGDKWQWLLSNLWKNVGLAWVQTHNLLTAGDPANWATKSDRGTPKEHFNNSIPVKIVSEAEIFTIAMYEQTYRLLVAIFWQNNMAWRILIEVQRRIISTKVFENQPTSFGREEFFSFSYHKIKNFELIQKLWKNFGQYTLCSGELTKPQKDAISPFHTTF